MIGRFFAGILAVFLCVMIPMKYKGLDIAEREENLVKEILSKAYAKTKQTGVISADTLENIRQEFYSYGIKCIPVIKIGTVFDGKTESVIAVSDKTGFHPVTEDTDVRGMLVTFIAESYESRFGERLANMFWDIYVPRKKIVCGGFIYG